MKFYKPGLSDSTVDLTDAQLAERINPSDVGMRQRLLNSGYLEGEPPASNLFNTQSNLNISQGSEGVRAGINGVKSAATDLASSLLDTETQLTIDDLKKQLNYRDPFAPFSTDEQQQIEQAGNIEGAKFDPLINEARESKRQGMPKATIAAGERGGFMNTQFSGAAALSETEGDTFVGAGGELENMKSAYDRNIADLQSKRLQAISLAKQKAQEAIRTGRAESNKQAMELFTLAKNANEQALDMIKKRQDIITSMDTVRQARVKSALDNISTLAGAGGTLNDAFINEADSLFGTGFAQKYYDTTLKAAKAKSDSEMIDAFKDIYDVLSKVPKGQKISMGGSEYEGLREDTNNVVIQETDNNGNVTVVTVDKGTGNIVATQKLGKVGKSKSSPGPSGNPGVSKNTADKLLASRGPDGYVNTGVYAEAFDEAVKGGAKAVRNFQSQFPAKVYLNPQDAIAKRFISTQAQIISSVEDEVDPLAAYLKARQEDQDNSGTITE